MGESEFLRQAYPELAGPEPVKRSVEKHVQKEKKSNPGFNAEGLSDEDRLDIHLRRIEKLLPQKDKAISEPGRRALASLEQNIIDSAVIQLHKANGQENLKLFKEISRNLFKAENAHARQEGRGADVNYIEEELGKLGAEQKDSKLIEMYRPKISEAEQAQRRSLQLWMDYLTGDGAEYPTWFKYLAIKAITKLGKLDEEKQEFGKRFPQTLIAFPELNQEALGKVHNHITSHPEEAPDFNKLYAHYLVETRSEKREAASTKGKWIEFKKKANPQKVMKRLEGYGTGWCIASNLGDMKRYLKDGELHIYFSEDDKGQAVIPRICIHVEHGEVAEIRGIAADQNLEGGMTEIAAQKQSTLFGGDQYNKKMSDMKQLTALEGKIQQNAQLTREEVMFLYELGSKIEGFGYENDPRIQELRSKRNTHEDAAVFFERSKEQIALTPQEINDSTKIYLGPLEKGIFKKFPSTIEQIYSPFPEGETKVTFEDMVIGGKTSQELLAELQDQSVELSPQARQMIGLKEFRASKTPKKVKVVRIKVKDLAAEEFRDKYRNSVSLPKEGDIYKKAYELGLQKFSPEAAVYYRLQYRDPVTARSQVHSTVVAMDVMPVTAGINLHPSEKSAPGIFQLQDTVEGKKLTWHRSTPNTSVFLHTDMIFCIPPESPEEKLLRAIFGDDSLDN
jgi:hypothetical protein